MLNLATLTLVPPRGIFPLGESEALVNVSLPVLMVEALVAFRTVHPEALGLM